MFFSGVYLNDDSFAGFWSRHPFPRLQLGSCDNLQVPFVVAETKGCTVIGSRNEEGDLEIEKVGKL